MTTLATEINKKILKSERFMSRRLAGFKDTAQGSSLPEGFRRGDSSLSVMCVCVYMCMPPPHVCAHTKEGREGRGRESKHGKCKYLLHLSKGHLDVYFHLFYGFRIFQNKKLGK